MTDRLVNAETLAAALLASGMFTSNVKHTDWSTASHAMQDYCREWAETVLAAIPPDPRLDALLEAAEWAGRDHDEDCTCSLHDALAAFEEKARG